MGKIFNLRKKSKSVFNRQRQGSNATKLEQQRVIQTIIDDLDTLRRLPREFKHINPQDIHCLVSFWKRKGLSVATIGNRLGVLRRFNQLAKLDLNIPSNEELGSIKSQPTSIKISIPENSEKTVFHPVTRSIISFQLHFGLTKLEAIRINPTVHNGALLIERTIAHNKKDRTIPIISGAQRETLSERRLIAQKSLLLSQQDKISLVNQLYTAECHDAGIDPRTPFRRHYAQSRLSMLEGAQDKSNALITLCEEMGFSAPRKLLGSLL